MHVNSARLFFVFILFLLISCETGEQKQARRESAQRRVHPTDTDTLASDEAGRISSNIDSLLYNRYKRHELNGVATITYHGKPFYKRVFGYADMESKDTLTANRCFQLASVSKPITAYGTLLLVQAGKLGLNDSISRYLPDFPYKEITVKMLLNQRSGLCNYMYVSDSFWPEQEKLMHNKDALRLFSETSPICYAKPDERFDYCNTNYMLLAVLIEKVSGMSFSDYMQRYVFKPLGMTHSFYITDSLHPAFALRVPGHNHKGEHAESSYLDGCLGDKGLYSNIEDMARFERALWEAKPLRQEYINLSIQPYSEEMKFSNYGYGWRLRKMDPNHWIPYHNGWWMGYKSYYARNIYKGISVIVLSNCTKGGFINSMQLVSLTN